MTRHAAPLGRQACETVRAARAGRTDAEQTGRTDREQTGRTTTDQMERTDTDRGSATVWAAGLIALLLLLGTVGIDVVSAVRARHVAATAADLAALAAAGVSSEGEQRACATARGSAETNGAALRECRLEGWDALVRVDVERGWTLVGRGPAAGVARAGPAPAEPLDRRENGTGNGPDEPPETGGR